MDNEKELVRFILQYLLDNHFESKSDMARQLDIRHRTMQRVFEQLNNDKAKGGTIVLDRALLFCAMRKISVDHLLIEYQKLHPSIAVGSKESRSAKYQLRFPVIDNLSESSREIYENSIQFLCAIFPYMCPHCEKWCNPLTSLEWINNSCIMGKLARSMIDTVNPQHEENG